MAFRFRTFQQAASEIPGITVCGNTAIRPNRFMKETPEGFPPLSCIWHGKVRKTSVGDIPVFFHNRIPDGFIWTCSVTENIQHTGQAFGHLPIFRQCIDMVSRRRSRIIPVLCRGSSNSFHGYPKRPHTTKTCRRFPLISLLTGD